MAACGVMLWDSIVYPGPLIIGFCVGYGLPGGFFTWRLLDCWWRSRDRRRALRQLKDAFDRQFAALEEEELPGCREFNSDSRFVCLRTIEKQRVIMILEHDDLNDVWLQAEHAGETPVRIIVLADSLATNLYYPAHITWNDEDEGDDETTRSFGWRIRYRYVYPASRHPQDCALASAAQLTVPDLTELRDLLAIGPAASDQTV
jgi:hypothetical protein